VVAIARIAAKWQTYCLRAAFSRRRVQRNLTSSASLPRPLTQLIARNCTCYPITRRNPEHRNVATVRVEIVCLTWGQLPLERSLSWRSHKSGDLSRCVDTTSGQSRRVSSYGDFVRDFSAVRCRVPLSAIRKVSSKCLVKTGLYPGPVWQRNKGCFLTPKTCHTHPCMCFCDSVCQHF